MGLIISPSGWLISNRSKGLPSPGSSNMTVLVQNQTNHAQTSEVVVDLKNATTVYCPAVVNDE